MDGIRPLGAGVSRDTTSAGIADQSSQFMQLLMSQLKAQDPTAPMDTNQMVGEFTQFNILDQVSQIRQLLQNDSKT